MCLLLMTHENPSESQRYSCKQFLRLNHEQNETLVLKLRKRNFALFVSVVKYISSFATKITWYLFLVKDLMLTLSTVIIFHFPSSPFIYHFIVDVLR